VEKTPFSSASTLTQLIRSRRTVYAFRPERAPRDALDRALDAARWAPIIISPSSKVPRFRLSGEPQRLVACGVEAVAEEFLEYRAGIGVCEKFRSALRIATAVTSSEGGIPGRTVPRPSADVSMTVRGLRPYARVRARTGNKAATHMASVGLGRSADPVAGAGAREGPLVQDRTGIRPQAHEAHRGGRYTDWARLTKPSERRQGACAASGRAGRKSEIRLC
jgi:nitroreductase